MDVRSIRSAHLVGIGGINVSAVAKLLLAAGVRVSGSDAVPNEQTEILKGMGANVIEHRALNIEQQTDVLIYSSAVPPSDPEREEARRLGIPEMNSFQFLGEWFRGKRVILVAGTHGKSTTTAMLGLILERARLDPTVIVGSKVPGFEHGNVRIGKSDLVVIEGDEYARHFLEFHPSGLVLNNIELDHTDVFPTIGDMVGAFRECLSHVANGGIVVANAMDANVTKLLNEPSERSIRTVRFGGADVDGWSVARAAHDGFNEVRIEKSGISYVFNLRVPGLHNAMNAAGAVLMARELGASYPDIAGALEAFKGIWRRFEFLGEKNGAKYYSDYGHHPTAVAATLRAAKEEFSDSRIVLCFQPHHRNRTKHLFLEFVPCFDEASVLVLCEIYDVPGREESEDADVSSQDLLDAVVRHDADRGVVRTVEYAPDPASAVRQTEALVRIGDVVIFMGAGDIDGAVRKLTPPTPGSTPSAPPS